MELFTSRQLEELLELHRSMDAAEERPGCLDTDPEVFYSDKQGESYHQARIICRACPVITECAAYAVKWEDDGYWGGIAPRDRARIRWAINKAERAARTA